MELKEVFEPVLNFIKSLQKKEKEPASKQAAKDRLKLVLMQDRASVSPDFFEMMKKEIIDVIKKYIEIDEEALEVQLTRGLEAGLEGPALYANIPIKNVKPMAPKGDNEEEKEEGELEIIEEVVEERPPLTEEEAEKVAESILNNLEKSAKEEKTEIIEDIVIEESIEKEEETKSKEVVEEVKPKKKRITSTTTKKKTTAKRKPTTSKKKEE